MSCYLWDKVCVKLSKIDKYIIDLLVDALTCNGFEKFAEQFKIDILLLKTNDHIIDTDQAKQKKIVCENAAGQKKSTRQAGNAFFP